MNLNLRGVSIHTICLLVLIASATPTTAGTISKAEAQRSVSAIEKDQETLLAKIPALGQIDQVVRDDCAAKVPGHTGNDSFCTCGAAVTMSMWRSGVDPKMLDRLKDFVNGTGTLKSTDFVKYEGPELYRPLCQLAGT